MGPTPRVSVIIACRDMARYIEAAVLSVLRQGLTEVEILVIDDGSSDESETLVRNLMASDGRIRMLEGAGRGPATARNIGLAAARGEWISILDGDDLMHPDRLEILIGHALRTGADIVADELLAFTETEDCRKAWPFFGDRLPLDGVAVELEDLFRSGGRLIDSPLGYLKPLIRRRFISDLDAQYRDDLVIGEDFDFLAKLLAGGARMICTSDPLYFYRRHSGSISYRLSIEQADQMVEASRQFGETNRAILKGRLWDDFNARHTRLKVSADTQRIISALKDRQLFKALGIGMRSVSAGAKAVFFLAEGQGRRLKELGKRLSGHKAHLAPEAPHYLVLAPATAAHPELTEGACDATIFIPPVPRSRAEKARIAGEIFSKSLKVAEIISTIPDKRQWVGYAFMASTCAK